MGFGLLGMLGAGAAIGARNGANANVQAQNQLEIERARNGMEMDREALRQKYLDRRYDRERSDSLIDAERMGAQKEREYTRSRTDKLADDELKRGHDLFLEDRKESGRNSRALLRIKSGEGKGGTSKGLALDNGEVFMPNSPEYRLAVDMVKSGNAANLDDAINIVISKGLVSQAAGSIQGLREGIVPTAQDMSKKLFGSNTQAQDVTQNAIRNFNPKTGRFE